MLNLVLHLNLQLFLNSQVDIMLMTRIIAVSLDIQSLWELQTSSQFFHLSPTKNPIRMSSLCYTRYTTVTIAYYHD